MTNCCCTARLRTEPEPKHFAIHANRIARHLNDNIDTYRDSRLTGEARRTTVTPFARAMLRSPWKHILFAGLAGVGAAAFVIMALFDSQNRWELLFNQLSFLVYCILITNIWRARKIISKNKQAIQEFTHYHGPTPHKLHKL